MLSILKTIVVNTTKYIFNFIRTYGLKKINTLFYVLNLTNY